jgi:hypothetical protein
MNNKNNRFGLVLLTLVPVALMWVVIFAWQPLNFWLLMTLAQGGMITIALALRYQQIKPKGITLTETAIGLGSALLLYGIFFVANEVSVLLFDFARDDIQNIYAIRDQAQATWIALLLLFIIGPGEEIYWRGLIQGTLVERLGPVKGVLITSACYALVHVVAWNFMLLGAAAVCGLFWGLLYQWRKNIYTVILSHAVWDVVVMVLFPIS